MSDVIELRLPPRGEYQSALRALIGVLAGDLSFNYDQIIQLRVAVSEAFLWTIRRFDRTEAEFSPADIVIRFETDPDWVRVSTLAWTGVPRGLTTSEDAESEALLESLVDDITIINDENGEFLLSMIKYRLSPGP